MLPVFVDTVAWVAHLNKRDALHQRAQQGLAALRRQSVPLVTTEFVLLEVADALCALPFRAGTVAFCQRSHRISTLRIIPASTSLLADGFTLYRQRLDKDWSLTDCTSFVVMSQAGITDALTSDQHFVQAGFVKLL